MSTFFIILILVLLFWPWIARSVGRMMRRYMARRYEDAMRRMMGMPSRKEERRRKRGKERQQTESRAERFARGRRGERRHPKPSYHAAELLRSVAVDVEYVEIREFKAESIAPDGRRVKVVCEEQVSDVEYTEIRISK